jgi:hypothetical protein
MRERVCVFVCVILYFIITSTYGIFLFSEQRHLVAQSPRYLHSTTFPPNNIKYNTYLATGIGGGKIGKWKCYLPSMDDGMRIGRYFFITFLSHSLTIVANYVRIINHPHASTLENVEAFTLETHYVKK